MSVLEDLATAQAFADDLCRTVGRLEQQVGAGLDVRRVRTDADHLRESIALLRDAAAQAGTARTTATPHRMAEHARTAEQVVIPDAPYDSSLWTNTDGLDDEGLGAQGRHAP
jgi:hypothetical protein